LKRIHSYCHPEEIHRYSNNNKHQEDPMEIKRSQQSLNITQVETDQRTEVSKKKPLVPNQYNTDTFESAKVRSDQNAKTADSTEPQPKTDPAAEAILSRQMLTARFEPSGIRKRPEEKAVTTKRELGTDEQEIANENTHDVPQTDPGTDTGTNGGARIPNGAFAGDARSRIDQRNEQLQDLVAKSGVDLNPKNNNAGGPPHAGPGGSYTPRNPLEGGPTGPTDPMKSVNQKYEQTVKLQDVNSPGNPTQAFRDAIHAADQNPTSGIGKGMIAAGSLGIDPTPAEIEAAKKGASQDKAEPKKEASTWEKVKEAVTNWWDDNKEDVKDAAVGATLDAAEEAAKYVPGAATALQGPSTVEEVTGDATDLLRGAELIGKMKEGNYEGMGSGTTPNSQKKPGTSTPDQDEYERQEFEKHKEEVRQALGDIGFDPYALPKKPVIQGDIDPAEDQQTSSGEYQPGLLQQFGKEGLVGNPGGVESNSSGGGGVNLGQRGTNIDYENGSGYVGRRLTNDPEDVDTSGAGNDPLIVVPREPKEEEEEEEDNRVSTQKKQ
jgi:hypothetical protein